MPFPERGEIIVAAAGDATRNLLKPLNACQKEGKGGTLYHGYTPSPGTGVQDIRTGSTTRLYEAGIKKPGIPEEWCLCVLRQFRS